MTLHNKESTPVGTQMEMDLKIIGGNPKEKLLVQLFDIGRISRKERPTFMVTVTTGDQWETNLGLIIDSIGGIGNEGEVWNITGAVVSSEGYIIGNCVNRLFEGQFNTNLRKGWLKLLSDFT